MSNKSFKFDIKLTYALHLKIGEAYLNVERTSTLLLQKIAFVLQYWRFCYVRLFVYIVPSDLLGNRLSEMKIRKSLFFLSQQNCMNVMQIKG